MSPDHLFEEACPTCGARVARVHPLAGRPCLLCNASEPLLPKDLQAAILALDCRSWQTGFGVN